MRDSLDTLDEPEAKASMIWIIGEYAERIDNAEELLEAFLDTFLEEAPEVQLQMLTATVKLFLKKPSTDREPLIPDGAQPGHFGDGRPRLTRPRVHLAPAVLGPGGCQGRGARDQAPIRDDLPRSTPVCSTSCCAKSR